MSGTHVLQHYQNNMLEGGGRLLGAGNVLGAWALDKRLVFPAESACVWIIKGRYTGLQSGPINGPSSSRHTGGSLIKTSPYGVSPTTSQCFIQGPARTHTAVKLPAFLSSPRIVDRPGTFVKISHGKRNPKEGEWDDKEREGGRGRVSKSAGQSRACPW